MIFYIVIMNNVRFIFYSFFLIISYTSIDLHLQKKFDTNQIQCTQLSLHNQELKSKCNLLQDKLDQLERNNIRLIQRLTEQVKKTHKIRQKKNLIFSQRIFVQFQNVLNGFHRKIVIFFVKKLFFYGKNYFMFMMMFQVY